MPAEAARKARAIKEQQEMSSLAVLESDSEEDSNGEDIAAPPAENTPSSKIKKTGTTAFIPPDILSRPNLVSLATWLKMTPMQQAAFCLHMRPDRRVRGQLCQCLNILCDS